MKKLYYCPVCKAHTEFSHYNDNSVVHGSSSTRFIAFKCKECGVLVGTVRQGKEI